MLIRLFSQDTETEQQKAFSLVSFYLNCLYERRRDVSLAFQALSGWHRLWGYWKDGKRKKKSRWSWWPLGCRWGKRSSRNDITVIVVVDGRGLLMCCTELGKTAKITHMYQAKPDQKLTLRECVYLNLAHGFERRLFWRIFSSTVMIWVEKICNVHQLDGFRLWVLSSHLYFNNVLQTLVPLYRGKYS